MSHKKIEIMDTTLRDGEQMSSVSFKPSEKLTIAEQLLEIGVPRIEVASARVSKGEEEAVRQICEMAERKGKLKAVEVLGFLDGNCSVDWVYNCGCRVINLLAKGSLRHLETQLKQTPEEHAGLIRKTAEYAKDKGININVYLEDWSNGMRESIEYVLEMLEKLEEMPVSRVMLPDTLGILNPLNTRNYVKRIKRMHSKMHMDFHAHNDYGMATGNSMAALNAGINGLHATMNNLGERAGNAPLDELVAAMKDHLGIDSGIKEEGLYGLSKLIESISGVHVSPTKPVTGDNVFTQTAGIHADGDKKGNLYQNKLAPERFGRKRNYALGKLMGRDSLQLNLGRLGITLTPEQEGKVYEELKRLGDMKRTIADTEELRLIIADVIGDLTHQKYRIGNYEVRSVKGKPSTGTIEIINGQKTYTASGTGDGGYDACMNALKNIFPELPELIDYKVRIPKGGTDALVETTITWKNSEKEFRTKGVHSDQVAAALYATERMLNIAQPKPKE
ncbi:MAG: alpha-isopropylmalate synthase regulatory domain-containing protein [Candidatus Woesearchaeota archaeon]